jgi:CO/xanthine dehydrogenase FAD-binding subunit
MKIITWYYPDNPAEAAGLSESDKVFLHSGGTGLLMSNLKGVQGLVDLNRLPLKDITSEKGVITFGSLCTYADVVSYLKKKNPKHLLVHSLHQSASTPLRNRITLGGTLAMAPPWSDLTGPLMALDARLTLEGKSSGEFSVEDYLTQKELRSGTVITSVKIPLECGLCAHYREVRTQRDMPLFNLTVVLNVEKERISDARLIAVGTRTKFTRMKEMETWLKGQSLKSVKIPEVEKRCLLSFGNKAGTDPEYLAVKASIELGRMIAGLAGVIS